MEIVRLGNAIRIRGAEEVPADLQLALAYANSAVPRLRGWAEERARVDSEIEVLESRLERWQSPDERGDSEPARIEEQLEGLDEQILRLRTRSRNIRSCTPRRVTILRLFLSSPLRSKSML